MKCYGNVDLCVKFISDELNKSMLGWWIALGMFLLIAIYLAFVRKP